MKQIDEVAAAYGLELVLATEMPVFPAGYPKWKKANGRKFFTTTCPLCLKTMHVSTHYQRWTCPCDRTFPYRKQHAPDVAGLVEHLTDCGWYDAVLFVIGTGKQPQRRRAPV